MRQKKIEEKPEETIETVSAEQSGPPKDIKLAEIQLRENSVLVIKKTNYMGEDRIDFRVWLNSPKYKGPTKQGFVLTMDKIDAFMEAVGQMKKKLGG